MWRVRCVSRADACPRPFLDSHIPGLMPARGWPPVCLQAVGWLVYEPEAGFKGRSGLLVIGSGGEAGVWSLGGVGVRAGDGMRTRMELPTLACPACPVQGQA